jgi:hypothetical protein
LLLWYSRSVPWNYARFLDYAAEHILLRKVGGGYIFTHRLLLEHFATLDQDLSATPHLLLEPTAYATSRLCDCGHLEDRSGIRFCPNCGRARM